MDFDFNDQQSQFQATFRSFLEQNCDIKRHAALTQGDGDDRVLLQRLADLGLFAMLVPEPFDGLGLSFVDLALVLEELGRALVGGAVVDTLVATDLVARHGSPFQQASLLPRLAAGKLRVVCAVVEAESGFGEANIRASVTSTADGWRLDGHKVLVPHAANADLIMIVTRVDPTQALGIVMLEPQRDGVTLRQQVTLDPADRCYTLTLDKVAVDAEDILGGVAAQPVARLSDVAAAAAALQLTGIASKVLDITVGYAGQRVQFGKPIGSFQAIKHKCADMAVAIDAARSAAYYAAWAIADDAPDRAKAVSMAKSFCGDTARLVCNDGVQIHGGMGFTWELGLHWYLRRAKVLEYSYGDAAFHRERVMATTLAELEGKA
jgi:alkylation response protein AidB-like acyl-CoA dehydrogenase